MGLLSQGTPLPWADARQYADHVRKHGIQQFLATYRRNKESGRRGELYWGDEVEYMLVRFDDAAKNATLSLRGYDVLTELMKDEEAAKVDGRDVDLLWRPEYARYMLEGTPGTPYGLKADELSKVQSSMKRRRVAAAQFLAPDEFLASVTSFPRLGDADLAPFLHPHVPAAPDHPDAASKSLFVPDDAINPHPRFRTLTANIRERRGQKVAINMPVFKDRNTPWPFREPGLDHEYATGQAKENHIYMDCMCFGMGCSCLQITLQASHMCEARHLYDQLAVLAPVMLALTASSPVFRGRLADVDCRWNVIAGSVDDRNNVERGVDPVAPVRSPQWNLDGDRDEQVDVTKVPRRIPKSRYDSISTYIATHASYRPEYNDIPLVIDRDIEAELLREGVDPLLARHVAHLFIRDPLVLYRELLVQDDAVVTDHFENLQSTNWQTMRFKPPPTTHPELGWRVEFRAMEVQLTDFENAAYSVFIVLVSRVILCLDLDLYIPLSLVDANMATAQQRDAVLNGQFWFRQAIFDEVKDLERELLDGARRHSPVRTENVPAPAAAAAAAINGATAAAAAAAADPSACGCASFAQRSRSNSPIRRLATASAPSSPPKALGGSLEQLDANVVHSDLSLDGTGSVGTGAATNGSTLPGSRTASPPPTNGAGAGAGLGGQWKPMTIDTIMNGRAGEFTGLIPLIRSFLDTLVMDAAVRAQVDGYLDFIADRAAGRVATTANWMRDYLMRHPEYKHDSRVTPAMAYDLLRECQKVTERDEFPKVAPVHHHHA
ncbi:glutamate--cysteine ligase [Blastocladiella emersonii ATCC 22665]|nr:glutamate--cysteine ligase [Blastocladiella emersonii ATCC 22665]